MFLSARLPQLLTKRRTRLFVGRICHIIAFILNLSLRTYVG